MTDSTRPCNFWVGGATAWGDCPAPGLRLLTVAADGSARLGEPQGAGGNPTFGEMLPNGNLLMVHELEKGQISLYSPGGSQAILLNSAATDSADPTHLAATQSGDVAIVANYSGGALTVHALTPLCVNNPLLKVEYQGSGPGQRQQSSHPHQVVINAEMESVLVPDLGLDVVHVHPLKDLANADPHHHDIALPPGSGPRHLVLAGPGRKGVAPDTMIVACELDNTVRAIDIATGEELSVAKPTVAESSFPSAIRATEGGLILVGNRGPDTVGVLRWDEENGVLTYVGEWACGGNHPRDLVLTCDERHVVVANLNSNDIAILRLDQDAPSLELVGTVETCSPTALIRA